MPEKLARYIRVHPEAEISMLVGNTETLLRKINTGELDFAVVEGYFHKAEYDYEVYSREHFIAVCSGSHVFEKTPQTVSDLFDSCVILREKGSGTREIFQRYLEERNCSVSDFQRSVEIGSISAIKALVAADCGVAFLYEAAVIKELESGAVRLIPLLDFEVYNNFTLVWRKNSIFDDRYHKFLRIY
jgi:DNA-binding transcriptional LysR family regulator